jgi:hypothetical protein
MSRSARWRQLLGALLVMVVLFGLVVHGYRTRFSLLLVVVILLPGWLLLVRGFPARSVSVGDDWLRLRAGRRDGWVQSDRLTSAKLEQRWANRYLTLEDHEGRRLRIDLDDLEANPEVFKVFQRAFRHSRQHGLRPNRATLAALRLPQ